MSLAWSRRLPKPVYLDDGRTIGTLAAARDFVAALPTPRRSGPLWRETVDILWQAAHHGRLESVRDAGAQFSRALERDGLI